MRIVRRLLLVWVKEGNREWDTVWLGDGEPGKESVCLLEVTELKFKSGNESLVELKR